MILFSGVGRTYYLTLEVTPSRLTGYNMSRALVYYCNLEEILLPGAWGGLLNCGVPSCVPHSCWATAGSTCKNVDR